MLFAIFDTPLMPPLSPLLVIDVADAGLFCLRHYAIYLLDIYALCTPSAMPLSAAAAADFAMPLSADLFITLLLPFFAC